MNVIDGRRWSFTCSPCVGLCRRRGRCAYALCDEQRQVERTMCNVSLFQLYVLRKNPKKVSNLNERTDGRAHAPVKKHSINFIFCCRLQSVLRSSNVTLYCQVNFCVNATELCCLKIEFVYLQQKCLFVFTTKLQ